MTFTFHALWMLCAMASPVLAAAPAGDRWTAVLPVAVGFGASAWWFGPSRLPDAVSVGVLAALVAAIRLVRPNGSILLACAAAGAFGGIWMSMLRVAGVPWPVAGALAAAPPMISANLTAMRARFAPRIVRDEALLIIVTLGLAVAVIPGILDGWRSAVALNIQDKSQTDLVVPAWALGLSAGSVALGGLFTVWRRG